MFELPHFSSTFRTFLIASMGVILLSQAGWSGPGPTPVPSPPVLSPDEPRPIDQLQQRLSKQYSSKTARTLKQAYEALQDEKYPKALSLAEKAGKDEDFADYAVWITVSALHGQAKDLLEKKSYPAALKLAQKAGLLALQIESTSPFSPLLKLMPRLIANSEITVGDVLWMTRKWQKSKTWYQKAFQRLSTQNQLFLLTPETLSSYAEICAKQTDPLCLAWVQRFYSQFNRKSEELKAVATYFPNPPDRPKYTRSSLKTSVPYKAPDLDQSAFDSVMKLYFEGKFSKASKGFRQFLDDYPRSGHRFRARYWLAQALSHEQEHEQAQKMYEQLQQDAPLTYYGLLSANGTGKPVDTAIDATLPLATEGDTALLPKEFIHLRRARHLIAEKAWNLAAIELKDVKPREELSSQFLIYLAMLNYKAKNYNNGFQIMGELLQRNHGGALTAYGLRMIFPQEFLDLIQKYSTETDLDPVLVLSLIKQESAFDYEIGSSVGAMGLMQLMPATASETSAGVKITSLLEAEENIRIGTKYLRKLMTRFNGNIVLSLAGYNAGPTAADRWMKDASAPKRGMLEFIESIPYKETREYVASIVRNYYWYTRQMSGEFPKSLNYFWNIYGPPENPAKLPTPDHSAKLQNENA